MALALCLTLLPATALAAPAHQTHPICGLNCSHTGDTKHPNDAFENAKWLTSSYGKLSVEKSPELSTGELLPDDKNDANCVLLEAGDEPGYYYLSTVENYNDNGYVRSYKTIKIKGNVTICLNGMQIEKVVDNTGSVGPVFEVPAGSTLTLTDCTGNGGNGRIVCNESSNGSGVYVNGGTLNLYSGQITKSYGQKGTGSNSSNKYGGGVYVNNGGTFNMNGGAITGNHANYGGGVYVKSGAFTMNGGTITGNTSSGGYGTLGFGGAGVYVEASGNFIMNNDASVTGNTMGYGSTGGGGVYVNGGTFEMHNNASVTNNTANNSKGSFGGGVYVNGGTFKMHNNASVTGNTATNGTLNGAGVYVSGSGNDTFTMNDNASVTGNTTTGDKDDDNGYGGGVYVNSGTFNMNGSASITKNNTAAKSYGGGVFVNSGTFNMTGGAIGGTNVGDANTAYNGGGVYMWGGTFNMSGTASIKSNIGNGVCVSDGVTFTVSGAPTVTGNTKEGAASNVFLAGSQTITIGGKLTGSPNSIGVTRGAGSVIAKGKDLTEKLTEADAQKFKSDKGFAVSVDTKNNQLVLTNSSAGTHRHNWNYQNDGDATIKATCTNSTGDCAYRTNPATVTISTDQTVYDCAQITEAPTAQLTYSDNWPAGPEGVAKADASKIAYYKSVDDGTSYAGPVTNKNELKKPGKYVALLYFNGKYLEAHFSVVDTSKQDPTYTPPTAKSGLVYTGENQPLIDHGSTNHGRMWYKLGTNDGYSTLVPMAKDAGSYTVYYKVEGDATHNDVAERSIMVTIARAELSGTPTFTKVTEAGKTLEDVTLTKPKDWPEGTFEWGDGATETSQDTQIVQGQAYSWYYRSANHFATGKIVPWANPSSGSSSGTTGGGSSSGGSGSSDSNPVIKTETKNNPDGSTTKTETRKDGSVTQTTTGKDGSVSKTETKKDGSSVTENKAADGSTGTVKTDKNGQTEANAKVSAKAVEDAKKSGEAVKAPVEVEAARDSNAAPTVKVELPQNSGKTEVEIPVSNAKPGTVAVLVHPDGTEEILKNSIPTEGGIRLTVDGSATVKIVDNSKDFIDTRNHWAREEIDFVSARELVNGMSDTIYAPNASATRAQLWTILARQNDADLNGGNTWYEKAQLWSKDKGISDGTEPNAAINRAQMVTMLWRTMGQPAATDKVSFADVPAGSYYAQAVAWAVESGITQGVGGGRFDPTATCTRAQIATFLARSMK